MRISRESLRDWEHAKAEPEGTLRIAGLGDSYAEGFQVPYNPLIASTASLGRSVSLGAASALGLETC